MCSNYSFSICPRFLQPFTALPEGRAPKALRSWISSYNTSRGPAIDVFNFGGGRYQTLPLAPPGGPPSTSSTSVVTVAGPCRQHPSGGPPSTSSTSEVAAVGSAASTHQGPAINVFNFGGGRCRTCRQHPPGGPPSTSSTAVVAAAGPTPAPPGGRHRRLQLLNLQLRHLPGARRQRFLALMVGTPGPPASAPPGGPPSLFLSVDGGHSRTSSSEPPGSAIEYRVKRLDNQVGRRKIGPTCGFATSHEVGPGASVDTLKTRYPRIHALSQDKLQDMHPRTATQAVASDHTSLQRWAPEPPRVLQPRTSPPC
jgi:hypothetical protein